MIYFTKFVKPQIVDSKKWKKSFKATEFLMKLAVIKKLCYSVPFGIYDTLATEKGCFIEFSNIF